jgi:hypothetical protein
MITALAEHAAGLDTNTKDNGNYSAVMFISCSCTSLVQKHIKRMDVWFSSHLLIVAV